MAVSPRNAPALEGLVLFCFGADNLLAVVFRDLRQKQPDVDDCVSGNISI